MSAAEREAWVGPYCDWRRAIAPMGKDTDQLGFAAGYQAGVQSNVHLVENAMALLSDYERQLSDNDAAIHSVSAELIEECAQAIEREVVPMARPDDPSNLDVTWNRACRSLAAKLRALRAEAVGT